MEKLIIYLMPALANVDAPGASPEVRGGRLLAPADRGTWHLSHGTLSIGR